jgi:carbamoylphosphate synthase large subunit
MQYFVVVGGGIEQLPMYKALQKKKIKSIAVDINPECPARKLCNIFIKVSTIDPVGVIKKIKLLKKKIIGVSTLGTDTAYTVSKIANFFHTNSISVSAALNISLKDRMKKIFIKNKINTPKFFLCSTYEELKKKILILNFPVIIKPIDGRGSDGVFYLTNNINLLSLFLEVKKRTKFKNIIVEKFLSGKQYSAEGFFEEDKFYLSGVALRYYDNLKFTKPNIIEAGGFIPAQLNKLQMLEIQSLMENVGKSLGVTKGPLKADLVYNKKNFAVIEAAGRLSGNYLASHYIRWTCGVNLVNLTINFALGILNKKSSLIRRNMQKFLSIRYFFPKVGVIKSVIFPKDIKNFKTFYDKKIFFKGKKMITRNITHRDRVGLIRCIGSDKNKVQNDSLKIINKIKFRYEK